MASTDLDTRISRLAERIEALAGSDPRSGDAQAFASLLGTVVPRLEEAREGLVASRTQLARLRPIVEGIPGEVFERELTRLAHVEVLLSSLNEALALAADPAR